MDPQKMFTDRYRGLAPLFSLFLILSFLTRTTLLIKARAFLSLTPWLFVKIYGVGLFHDVVTLLYFAIPIVLYLLLVPDRLFRSRFHKPFLYLIFFAAVYILLFTAAAEYFFFDEFGTRFNFIAVDYLLYTRELMNNMKESYPLAPLFGGMALISLIVLFFMQKGLEASMKAKTLFRNRLKRGWVFLGLPLVFSFVIDASLTNISSNNYANELSANGIYNFFTAFKTNRIDYDAFYSTLAPRKALMHLKSLLEEENGVSVKEDPFDITREIKAPGREKKLNIAVIVVESLSAEYLGVFDSKRNLAPNLDRLSSESLFFTNIYATGNRTDRGLESIVLSVPPTPGRSIVKRPNHENMFSWGFLMKERGYDTKFIYGGYGYFDNMNSFFSQNGFETVDRKDFRKEEITFENAWGVCDEDLYNKSLAEFDKSFEKKVPFFGVMLTTSNHRPFTYPSGRIDIPSHTGRTGGVKYTDYAIGKFLDAARKKPWFEDTLFVIVADHCASSAGKTTLPVKRYRIPLFIYSPAHIKPQRVDKLVSQIDIAPTVLGLLNFTYQSKFFGRDALKTDPSQERALIATYQRLGLVKKDRLVVLDIKKKASLFRLDGKTGDITPIAPDQSLFDDAISYYQGADYLFRRHLNRWVPTNDAKGLSPAFVSRENLALAVAEKLSQQTRRGN
jgi:phosphoglycerol transferase MdoB-like AlkP superfamily enzyme